jgi:hypothetical protein
MATTVKSEATRDIRLKEGRSVEKRNFIGRLIFFFVSLNRVFLRGGHSRIGRIPVPAGLAAGDEENTQDKGEK